MRKKVIIGVALLLSLSLLAACGVPQEDYDAAVAAKDAAEAKVASLQSNLSKAQSDLAKAKSDLAAAEAALATCQSDLEAAQAEAASAESAASAAKSKLSSAQSDLAAAEAALAAAEATIAELEAELAAAEEVVEEEEEVVEEEEEVVEEEEEVVEEEEEEVEAGALGYEHPDELSFAATQVEYVNEEYGFSIQYDSIWDDNTGEGDIWGRIAGSGVTGTFISAAEAAPYATFVEFLIGELSDEADVEIVDNWTTTLSDGTPAFAAEFNTVLAGWDMHCFAVGLIIGDNWVAYCSWNIDVFAAWDTTVDMVKEVLHTLLVLE